MTRQSAACCLAWALCLMGCNFTPAGTTGGADLPSRGECPRGLALVSSDYQSSEIALITPEAGVASSAFLSSASTRASGLAAPISGDISVATARPGSGELIVVDRFGTDVLSFVDTRTALVRAQLPIGTGFEANPQQYLELDEHHGFVPRLGENHAPGREPFDSGSDVLVIDPSVPAIVGSLPMPTEDGYLSNPSAITRLGDDLLVTLVHQNGDFSAVADSELVVISSSELSISHRLRLDGLKNCGRAELSPSGSLLAIACSSFLDRKGNAPDPSASAVVLLDATTQPPRELRRFAALDLVGQPVQSRLEFVSERTALIKTQTALGGSADNQLFSLDLESGATQLLATAQRSAAGRGYGIALNGMSCLKRCGDLCFVSDASRGKVLTFRVEGERLTPAAELTIDGAGLPPTSIEPLF